MATVCTPRSESARRIRCSSTGPGVVSPPPPGRTSPSLPTRTPSVPIDALDSLPSSNRCRMIDVVVVLRDNRESESKCSRGNPRVVDRHPLVRITQQQPQTSP